MPTVFEQITALETRINHLESVLGVQKKSPPPKLIISASKHREAVMQVLSDGVPKNISTITKAVSEAMGKKQNRGSINCMCSSLFLSGYLVRQSTGVYQKKLV